MRNIRMLAAGLFLALGIVPTMVIPASAAGLTSTACDEDIEWQRDTLGTNKYMGSCFLSLSVPWERVAYYSVRTYLNSTSFWTGFHGCAGVQFLKDGSVVAQSATQRWGVGASHSRLVEWSGSTDVGIEWSTARFVHWRC
jgi:hypothetical protein